MNNVLYNIILHFITNSISLKLQRVMKNKPVVKNIKCMWCFISHLTKTCYIILLSTKYQTFSD